VANSPEHYFAAQPVVASAPRQVTVALRDVTVELTTDAGVFSGGGLDPGTRLLLENAPLPALTGDVLDLGCGYGPIAVVQAARLPGRRVYAVDVNERALALTRANAAAAGSGDVVAVRPDQVPGDVRFAAIYSNPPIRIGKAALHALLLEWLPRLAPGGSAYLVVARNLGADSLARWLEEQGCAVERLRSQKGYRVLAVRPTGDSPGPSPIPGGQR
jgi:16S rRNA (guanine1207-N2)-methyltransferase